MSIIVLAMKSITIDGREGLDTSKVIDYKELAEKRILKFDPNVCLNIINSFSRTNKLANLANTSLSILNSINNRETLTNQQGNVILFS